MEHMSHLAEYDARVHEVPGPLDTALEWGVDDGDAGWPTAKEGGQDGGV